MRSSRHLHLVVAATLALTACATGEDPPPDAAEGDDAEGAGDDATDGAFPVTIATAFGDVTVEAAPERVVALGWSDAETALALGVEPIGASDWLEFGGDGVGPWAEGLYDTPPTLVGTMEPDIEALAALDPDLILDTRSDGTQERHDALAQVATVLGPPPDVVPYGTTWRQQTEMVGQALGRTAEADALVAEVDQRFAEVAADNAQFDGAVVAIGAYTSEGWGAYVRGDSRVDFAEELGFVNDPELEELAGEYPFVMISDEQVDLLDADLTVVFPIFVEASAFTDDALWLALPSVADGRSVVLEDTDTASAFSSGSALGTRYALDEVAPVFADALTDES